MNKSAAIAFLTAAGIVWSLPPKDGVAALVGDQVVLASEVREAALSLGNNPVMGRLPLPERCDRLLTQMVDDKVLLVRAKLDTIQVSDAELSGDVESQMQSMQSSFGGEDAFRQSLLTHLGLQPSDMRLRILRQVRDDRIRSKVREKYVGRVEVTHDDVISFFKQYKDSLPDLADQVKVSQIQLKIVADPARDSVARAEAVALIEKLKKGESFESLASKWSQEPGADSSHGDIGYFKRGDLDPAYEKAALALEAGQYTMVPVRSRFGWHVIQLVQKKDNEFRTRHILRLVQPDSLDVARTKALADSLRLVSRNDTGTFAQLARKYSTDQASAAFGGLLGWFDLGKLKEPFKSILDSIPEGQVGEPRRLGEAFTLFRVDRRAQNRKMNLDEDWMALQNYAQGVVSQKKLEVFLQRWRTETSIERRMDGKAIAAGMETPQSKSAETVPEGSLNAVSPAVP
jgi:peptidyl-prolyl cis-trans isomerase SurA